MGGTGKPRTTECWHIVEDFRGAIRRVCETPRELAVDTEREVGERRPVGISVHEENEGIYRDAGEIHGDDSFWVADMPGGVVPSSVEYLTSVGGGRVNDAAVTDVPLVPPVENREVGRGYFGDLVSIKVVDGAVYLKSVHFR